MASGSSRTRKQGQVAALLARNHPGACSRRPICSEERSWVHGSRSLGATIRSSALVDAGSTATTGAWPSPTTTEGLAAEGCGHLNFSWDPERPGTFGNCTAKEKLDYILLSPKLFGKVAGGAVLRKGIRGGKNGTLAQLAAINTTASRGSKRSRASVR